MKDFKKVELKSFFRFQFFVSNIIIFDYFAILFVYLYLCKIDHVLPKACIMYILYSNNCLYIYTSK